MNAAPSYNAPGVGALDRIQGQMNWGNPFFSIILIVIFFAILVLYHKSIGYYITLGWNRVRGMMGQDTQLDVSTTAGGLDATIYPDHSGATNNGSILNGGGGGGGANVQPAPMLPPEQRPSGMPGATESSLKSALFGELNNPIGSSKEVFNISRNIYSFNDAAAVCAAYGSDLANYDQVKEAYDNGADWCNYGWIKGQMAVFPTQKSTYERLQKGSPAYRTACGKPGVNGGYFDNPDLRFGVNCYGVKPVKKASDEMLESLVALPPSPEDIEFDRQVQKFREQLDTTAVLPFHKGRWSE